MKIESRGVSSPSFAVLRELTRVYAESLRQTLVVWPARFSHNLLFDSGLDTFWKKHRLIEIFEPCLDGLKAQLGPAYQNLFSGGGREAEFPGSAAFTFGEVTAVLDRWFPEWTHEFIIDREPIFSAPLYQIHSASDEQGQRWHLKVIKPLAKEKLESTLYALREIEVALRPLRRAPPAAKFAHRLEDLRRAMYREADLSLERRTLLRMKAKVEVDKKVILRLPRVNERFSNEALLVYEALDGVSLDLDAFDSNRIDMSERAFLARKRIQCSVLKAFEMGLIRHRQDSRKLVLMKDGVIAVRGEWMKAGADGNDRIQAANLLRAYFSGDAASLAQEVERAYPGPDALKKDQPAPKGWRERLAEFTAKSESFTVVDFAELVLKHTESIGIESPQGFLPTARILDSLQGIGRPIHTAIPSLAHIGAEGRVAADQDVDLTSHIVRASRLRSS